MKPSEIICIPRSVIEERIKELKQAQTSFKFQDANQYNELGFEIMILSRLLEKSKPLTPYLEDAFDEGYCHGDFGTE